MSVEAWTEAVAVARRDGEAWPCGAEAGVKLTAQFYDAESYDFVVSHDYDVIDARSVWSYKVWVDGLRFAAITVHPAWPSRDQWPPDDEIAGDLLTAVVRKGIRLSRAADVLAAALIGSGL